MLNNLVNFIKKNGFVFLSGIQSPSLLKSLEYTVEDDKGKGDK